MRIHATCLAAITAATLTATASAVTVYEGFDYTVGETVHTQNGGLGFDGGWYNVVGSQGEVIADSLMDPTGTLLTTGNTGSEIDDGRLYRLLEDPFPNDVDPVYISFLMEVTSDEPYNGFELFDGGNNDQFRTLQVANIEGDFQVRLDNDAATSASLPTPGTGTHLYVLRIDYSQPNAVSVYVDPDPTQPEPILADASVASSDASAGVPFDRVAFGIFQGNREESLLVDELRIGDSFDDVTPFPEPASIGLLGVAGLGLMRRRR